VKVSVKALDVNDHDAVFRVFDEFRAEFGTIEKVVVNAGLGKGQPLGTGRFDVNLETAQTNFIGALAQTEAAAGIFREQNAGQLVMISSISAVRGMPRNITTYAATKAAVAHLAEGYRADVMNTPIKVTVLYPGYIISEMSATSKTTPLVASTEKGVRAMVSAIEKQKASARVPAWPWVPVGFALEHLPLPLARKLMG
jgi:short-subunit dehydrogenase